MGASIGDVMASAIRRATVQSERTPVYSPTNLPSGFKPVSEPDVEYTQANRPGYSEFGPSGQFQQPIYRSSYEGYVQPAAFYAPSYDMPAFYNPFAVPVTAETPVAEGSAAPTAMASGGMAQGIDSLLK